MKYQYWKKILFFLSFVLLQTCIAPFYPEIDIGDTESILVVEGQITNEEGPFKVRLTESVSVYSDPNVLNNEYPISGADVQIFDDQGNDFKLYETEDGWYETENKQLSGIVGNTYTLTITTPDGQEYESSPVLMLEVPDIEDVYYGEYKLTQFEEQEPIEENWLNILVDSKAPIEENVYLRWDFEETWMFEMPTYIEVNHGMGEGDPPPTMEIVDVDPDRISCWITEPSRDILVESSVKYQDGGIKGYVLQSIGTNSDRLNIKYSILVKQYAISKELYTFFKKLREVNTDTEGIYSKNPGQVFGNITNCETGENILGYFSASAVKAKRIFIEPYEHNIDKGNGYEECGWTDNPPRDPRTGEFTQPTYVYGTRIGSSGNEIIVYSTEEYCVDCRLRGYSTKPDFWE